MLRIRKPIIDLHFGLEMLNMSLEPSIVVILFGWAGSDRLKSMHLVLLVYKSFWRSRKECCMALKLVWRFVNGVQRRARCIQNGAVCVEVYQGITLSKSDILDIYREKKLA